MDFVNGLFYQDRKRRTQAPVLAMEGFIWHL